MSTEVSLVPLVISLFGFPPFFETKISTKSACLSFNKLDLLILYLLITNSIKIAFFNSL